MNVEEMKKAVARAALEFIEDDMVVGLGTGSTTAYFIRYLGEMIEKGKFEDIYGDRKSVV